jgi:hypothetical protein
MLMTTTNTNTATITIAIDPIAPDKFCWFAQLDGDANIGGCSYTDGDTLDVVDVEGEDASDDDLLAGLPKWLAESGLPVEVCRLR